MPRISIRLLCVLAASLIASPLSQANDIEDFFRALRGSGSRSQADRHGAAGHDHDSHGDAAHLHPVAAGGHGHHHSVASGLSSRDIYKRNQQFAQNYGVPGRIGSVSDHNHNRYELTDPHDVRYGRGLTGSRSSALSGSRFSVRLNIGGSNPVLQPVVYPQAPVVVYPPVPQVPVMPVYPAGPSIHALPHQIGEIVDCIVPLATCVRVEDAHKIAPNAVPVVVAVRDPNLPPHVEGCVHSVVFVEVCVPPCPLRSLTISPCKTRIKMDFGQYEVDIRSTGGVIRVDYDN